MRGNEDWKVWNMENYTDISKKYLMKNRKRTIYTIIGCALVATILFAILNSFSNWWIKWRSEIRAKADWEILVYNDDKDTAEAIVNEDFVRSAAMGDAQSENRYYTNEGVTANSIYLNVKNIRKVKKYGEYIQNRYGVEVSYNDWLLETYILDVYSGAWIAVILCIFIAYIFAIIGIGIIRNSISISAIERLRDYGDLRCIGATKGQIKNIVFREALIQEGIGVGAGIIAGYIISVIFCFSHSFPLGFHIVPALMVAISFLFDLYFVIRENTKKITSVSPVDAVRGNYRIKVGKVRQIRSGLWGLLFGVEGAYAYKNVKRNRLRFVKSVSAIAFGIATVVVVGSTIGYLIDYVKLSDDMHGYYQEYQEGSAYPFYSKDEVKATLFTPDQIRGIQGLRGVEDMSYLYRTILYTKDNNEIYSRFTEEYNYFYVTEGGLVLGEDIEKEFNNLRTYDELTDQEKEAYGDEQNYINSMERRKEYLEKRVKEYEDKWERSYNRDGQLLDYDELCFQDGEYTYPSYIPSQILSNAEVGLYGYEGKDWDRYRDHLVEGTLDISDRGIVLVNGGYGFDWEFLWTIDSKNIAPTYYSYTDFRIGDEITFVDPQELYDLVQKEKKKASEYDKLHAAEEEKWHKEHDGEWADAHPEEYKAHNDYEKITTHTNGRGWIVEAARQQLISEGKCKTYIIEGIVDKDVNHYDQGPIFIMPLDKYLAATGSTKEDYTGFQYHIGNTLFSELGSEKYDDVINENSLYGYESDALGNGPAEKTYYEDYDIYPQNSKYILTTNVVTMFKPMMYCGAVILVIILVNCLNILNVTMSNIALRRNEFAQMRAIGMTKGSLYKGVILEGVIMWIAACVLGIGIGIPILYMIHSQILVYLIYSEFSINWLSIIVAVITSFIVLVGAYYFPMKRMKLDVAEELMRSGE